MLLPSIQERPLALALLLAVLLDSVPTGACHLVFSFRSSSPRRGPGGSCGGLREPGELLAGRADHARALRPRNVREHERGLAVLADNGLAFSLRHHTPPAARGASLPSVLAEVGAEPE